MAKGKKQKQTTLTSAPPPPTPFFSDETASQEKGEGKGGEGVENGEDTKRSMTPDKTISPKQKKKQKLACREAGLRKRRRKRKREGRKKKRKKKKRESEKE
ncbi:hypothetical protein BaRGS_00013379 [Batillaria attramentaria]|uniref:Uncharacterized protein n=1 Tax=Batillaria attramentaria TaxID=370345 RepID=A0ABD0L7Y6_9CAEN